MALRDCALRALLVVILVPVTVLGQSAPEARPPEKPGETQKAPAAAVEPGAQPGSQPGDQANIQPDIQPNKAAAYYHYALAHMYEELVTLYGRSDLANKAIEEYRKAIENDPGSDFLAAGLAELYAKLNRIRDAVTEAQAILKRNPRNIEARKLLGRIYLRSLGDMQTGTQSKEMLRLAIDQFEQITALEPGATENFLLLGRLYILNKDLLKAEESFKAALRAQPDSEEALTSLAYLYNEEGNTSKAVELLTSLPDSAQSAKLYAALGYTYEQRQEYKKAVEAYRKAVEFDGENLDAVRGLATNLLHDGQVEAALEQFNAVLEADPQDAQSLLRVSEIQRKLGRFDEALETLKKAEGVVPDSQEIPFNIALVYSMQGRYDEALQIMNGLLEKSTKPTGNYSPQEANNRAVFLERIGSLYREAGRNQLALETFRQMLSMGDEVAARGYQQMIDTYREAKQWSQATQVAQEAVQKLPKHRMLKLVLAGQLVDVGQPEKGFELAKSLIQGGKDDREIYVGLAQIHARAKNWKQAEESLAKAEQLSQSPEEKEYVDFVKGSILERQKKYDQAEDVFRKILARDPDNAMVLNYLGYMLADRGVRLEEALGMIKKAVRQDPNNGAYLDSLGWAYFKLGNYPLAEENLRKAISRQPNDPTLHHHIADLYFRTGRLKLAAAHWERAVEEWNRSIPAEVDNEEFQRVQKKLESARIRLAQQRGESE